MAFIGAIIIGLIVLLVSWHDIFEDIHAAKFLDTMWKEERDSKYRKKENDKIDIS